MEDNRGSPGGTLCVYVRPRDGRKGSWPTGYVYYKCKTSKVSEVVGEKRTILNLPLQFVLLNNLKKIIWLSGICVASLLLAQNCHKSLRGATLAEFCCRVEREEGRRLRRQRSGKQVRSSHAVFTERGGDVCICLSHTSNKHTYTC